MRKLMGFGFVITCILLTACDRTIVNLPPRVLDFNTHPSVLRGNWSARLTDFSTDSDVDFGLIGLTASCKNPNEKNQCTSYTFQGQVQVGTTSPVPITGEGFANAGTIYALTSPIPAISFSATFTFAGKLWTIESYYFDDGTGETALSTAPHYQTILRSSDETGSVLYSFILESSPPLP
jgi:hypothetical protein